jgi:membrane protein DedA with SNARE-associated domain
VIPLGNDLLLIVLTARRHALLFYYAAMATAGSVAGCLIMDLSSRGGGEKGLKSTIGDKRTEYVKKRVNRHGGWALAVAALMPQPFPFTPFVAGAAALQYPRKNCSASLRSAGLCDFRSTAHWPSCLVPAF